MAITISQRDYWALFDEESQTELGCDWSNTYRQYPAALGSGSMLNICLREGLELEITNYRLNQAVTLYTQDRPHSLQYCFVLDGGFSNQKYLVSSGHYSLCGSGLAPGELAQSISLRQQAINVHIDPMLFLQFWHSNLETLQPELKHLIMPVLSVHYRRSGVTTLEMQAVLQQMLHCPFAGSIRRIYLENKVWELMLLLMAQELEQSNFIVNQLKPDDIERVYHAREILLKQLHNPPSLIDLAHQVGLNDCTLKRGFKQVFGTSAFKYLHDYRLEKAKQMLEERRLNVSEVAKEIGFSNRSYIAATFQKKFGVTPRAFLTSRRNSV